MSSVSARTTETNSRSGSATTSGVKLSAGSGMPLSMWSRFSIVAPLVSKWKFDGRCAETGSFRRSKPFSDNLMTSAAMTVFVMLAMPNCELASTGCTSSAVPAAPVHALPSAVSTVAVTPGSPPLTAPSRTACRAPEAD